ncbi:MAG: hypothetical protein AAGF26_15610, partial [Cyanobacteria bacterium P01_G01_bin.49]
YRQWYSSNRDLVMTANPHLKAPQAIDLAIATELLKISDDHNDVGRILSQSDMAQSWRKTLSENEAQTQIYQYANQTYQQAKEFLQQEIEQERQQQPVEPMQL